MISSANYGRSLVIEGNSDDSDWHRLTEDFPGIRLIRGVEGSGTMEILQYAAFTKHAVDVEICVSERIETRRRWLEPIRVLNLKEIIAQARERLDLLEETYA